MSLYNDVGDILQSQLAEANNDYTLKQDEYTRVKQLAQKGIAPKALAVQKLSRMKSAQARLTHAQHTINHCDLIAPAAGFIYERNAVIGELVSSNQALYRIAGGRQVEVKASVPESELGQEAMIHISGHPQRIRGNIRRITPKVNPNSRTADVSISLNNNPNLQGSCKIQVGR